MHTKKQIGYSNRSRALNMLGNNISRRHFKFFSYFFPRKHSLKRFMQIVSFLRGQFAWNVKLSNPVIPLLLTFFHHETVFRGELRNNSSYNQLRKKNRIYLFEMYAKQKPYDYDYKIFFRSTLSNKVNKGIIPTLSFWNTGSRAENHGNVWIHKNVSCLWILLLISVMVNF